LANIKSQIKRNKQNEKRRLRNRIYRGGARVAVRDARNSMESEKAEESRTAVLAAISALDKAAEKGVIHRNNAARRKGRLMKQLSAMGVQIGKSVKADKPPVEQPEETKKAAPKKKAAAPKKPAAKKTAAAKKPAAAKTTKKPAASKTTKKSTASKTTKKTTTRKTTKK